MMHEILLVAIAVVLAVPVVDRVLVRRRRIGFEVLYNSKLGIGGPWDRLSLVVVSIRNTGASDIGPQDFERPLSFSFGRRVVRGARVADQEIEVEPGSHSIKLDRNSLRRGQEVTLAVVLDEPGDGTRSKQMELAGKLKHAGVIADDERPATLSHVAWTLAVVLIFVLVVSLI